MTAYPDKSVEYMVGSLQELVSMPVPSSREVFAECADKQALLALKVIRELRNGAKPLPNDLHPDCFRRMLELLDITEEEFLAALRELLWVALVWNDHNFSIELIREKAKEVSKHLNLDHTKYGSVDKYNEVMKQISNPTDPYQPCTATTVPVMR